MQTANNAPASKEQKLFELIGQLRRNYTIEPSTFSYCKSDNCNHAARGGGLCAECCERQIAELTDMPLEASKFHANTITNANLINRFQESVTAHRKAS